MEERNGGRGGMTVVRAHGSRALRGGDIKEEGEDDGAQDACPPLSERKHSPSQAYSCLPMYACPAEHEGRPLAVSGLRRAYIALKALTLDVVHQPSIVEGVRPA